MPAGANRCQHLRPRDRLRPATSPIPAGSRPGRKRPYKAEGPGSIPGAPTGIVPGRRGVPLFPHPDQRDRLPDELRSGRRSHEPRHKPLRQYLDGLGPREVSGG
jgi:hypothetical protein